MINENIFIHKYVNNLPLTGTEQTFYKLCRKVAASILINSQELNYEDILYKVILANLYNKPTPVLKKNENVSYELLKTKKDTDEIFYLVILPINYFKKVTNNE